MASLQWNNVQAGQGSQQGYVTAGNLFNNAMNTFQGMTDKAIARKSDEVIGQLQGVATNEQDLQKLKADLITQNAGNVDVSKINEQGLVLGNQLQNRNFKLDDVERQRVRDSDARYQNELGQMNWEDTQQFNQDKFASDVKYRDQQAIADNQHRNATLANQNRNYGLQVQQMDNALKAKALEYAATYGGDPQIVYQQLGGTGSTGSIGSNAAQAPVTAPSLLATPTQEQVANSPTVSTTGGQIPGVTSNNVTARSLTGLTDTRMDQPTNTGSAGEFSMLLNSNMQAQKAPVALQSVNPSMGSIGLDLGQEFANKPVLNAAEQGTAIAQLSDYFKQQGYSDTRATEQAIASVTGKTDPMDTKIAELKANLVSQGVSAEVAERTAIEQTTNQGFFDKVGRAIPTPRTAIASGTAFATDAFNNIVGAAAKGADAANLAWQGVPISNAVNIGFKEKVDTTPKNVPFNPSNPLKKDAEVRLTELDKRLQAAATPITNVTTTVDSVAVNTPATASPAEVKAAKVQQDAAAKQQADAFTSKYVRPDTGTLDVVSVIQDPSFTQMDLAQQYNVITNLEHAYNKQKSSFVSSAVNKHVTDKVASMAYMGMTPESYRNSVNGKAEIKQITTELKDRLKDSTDSPELLKDTKSSIKSRMEAERNAVTKQLTEASDMRLQDFFGTKDGQATDTAKVVTSALPVFNSINKGAIDPSQLINATDILATLGNVDSTMFGTLIHGKGIHDLLMKAKGSGNTTAKQFVANLGERKLKELKAATSNKEIYDLLK